MARAKYGNKKVEVDGITFDSKIEARYYQYLKQLKKQGIVKDFELQPKFILLERFKKNGKTFRSIEYIADFKVEYPNGYVEVVDIKGMETKDFKIKRKLFEYRYPATLKVLTFSAIDGGWIELEQYNKAKNARKRARKHGGTKQTITKRSATKTKNYV